MGGGEEWKCEQTDGQETTSRWLIERAFPRGLCTSHHFFFFFSVLEPRSVVKKEEKVVSEIDAIGTKEREKNKKNDRMGEKVQGSKKERRGIFLMKVSWICDYD